MGIGLDCRNWSAVLLRRLRASLRARAFGYYICHSVNDAVLLGRPYGYTLADGEPATLDLDVSRGGVAADSAISFIVGDTKPPERVAMISDPARN